MAPDLEMVFPQPPLSPTLTNPDMILPDTYGFSPTGKYQVPHSQTDYSYAQPVGQAVTIQARRANGSGPRPRSPSVLRLARPLSDIQEVETGQTTPKAHADPYTMDALASSPILTDHADMARWEAQEERRLSDESGSSVHSEDLENLKWPGFDSTVGADEESVVLDEEEEEKFGSFPKVVGSDESVDNDTDEDQWLGPKTEDETENKKKEDDLFQDPLSRRADMILANAKKRLNVMEGNLRGARSSLHINTGRPLSAMNTFSGALRDRERLTTRTSLGHRTRQFSPSPLSSLSTPTHSRMASEASIPSPVPSVPAPRPPAIVQKRASSAMGGFMGGYPALDRSASLRGVRSQEVIRDSRIQDWIMDALPHSAGLIPHSSASQTSERSITLSQDWNAIRRSSSTTGGLRAQMDELKGKISSLRERAREENLRRQSLNSLRTPSPFTVAENWYQGAESYKAQAWSTDAGVGWSPNTSPVTQSAPTGLEARQSRLLSTQKLHDTGTTSNSQASRSEYQESNYEDAESSPGHPKPASDESSGTPGTPASTVEKTEDNFDDFREEKVLMGPDDPSLDEPPTPRPAPVAPEEEESGDEGFDEESTSGNTEFFEAPVVAERHEDRADAFDYEHFFLHSAMGTLRRGSMSSEDSVETTRPISPKRPTTAVQITANGDDSKTRPAHRRSQSIETLSSVASFQTATEGNGSDKGDEEESDGENPLDAVTQQILNNNAPAPAPATPTLPSPIKIPHLDSPAKSSPKRIPEPPVTPTTAAKSLLYMHSPGLALASTFLENDSISGPSSQLQQDRALVANVLTSLQQACLKMQNQPTDAYERRLWRRRLDAARKALEGETDDEELS